VKCFELTIVTSTVTRSNGSHVTDSDVMCHVADAAAAVLDPILKCYDQSAFFYFDKVINVGERVPWAIACLNREYSLAGHIACVRPPDSEIRFAPYTKVPLPIPDRFVPRVGILVFGSRVGLEQSVSQSPLLESAWESLRACDAEGHWLALLDPPNDRWLALLEPVDDEAWLALRRV